MLRCTCQATAELVVLYPVNGAFYTHVVRFIDPSRGFAVGWPDAESKPDAETLFMMTMESQTLRSVWPFTCPPSGQVRSW
jgi:hypothetical protein